MKDRRTLGQSGEDLAAARLEAMGISILARNVRMPSGEIDIIGRDGDEVVFVEVRARRSEPGTAAESVDGPKLQRMWQCAMDWCEREDADPDHVRLDLVAIDLGRNGPPLVSHFRGLEVPD